MKNRHIIFLIMIIIALCGIILSVSYGLNVSVIENATSNYDLSYILTLLGSVVAAAVTMVLLQECLISNITVVPAMVILQLVQY